MKAQKKYIILSILVVSLFSIGFIIYQNREINRLLQDEQKDKKINIEKLWNLNGRSLETLVYDYTYWDDMVKLVSIPNNIEWAEDTIDESVLSSYNANCVWIYHIDESLAYSILDLTIPGGMGGIETIKRLLLIDPDAKVVVSSGYSSDEVMSDYKKYGFKEAIMKPYRIDDVSRIIGKVIMSSDT